MNPFAFCYREQQQLFLFEGSYIWATLLKVGGLSTLCARFVVQFFRTPTLAVALTLALLTLSLFFLWAAVRRSWKDIPALLLCMVPVFFVAASLCDNAMHFDFLLSFLFAVAGLLVYSKIKANRVLWGSALSAALYFLAGPSAILFALCAFLSDLPDGKGKGLRSIIIVAVAFCFAALSYYAARVPTWAAALTPAFHYDIDAAMPFAHWAAWIALPLSIVLDRSLELIKGKAVRYAVAAGLAIVALFPASKFSKDFEDERENMNYEFEYYVAREDWKGLEKACKHHEWLPRTANYLNLALAHQGRLCDDLFKHDQRGPMSLIMSHENRAVDLLTAHIMFAMGNAAAAQDVAFNCLFSLQGYCPEMLKMNAQIEIMRGSLDIADKYLSILEKAPFYRKWACSRRVFLSDESALMADPVLGSGRRGFPLEDDFAMFYDPMTELFRIIEADPSNATAMQYGLSFLLLAKDMYSLQQFVDTFYGTEGLPELPVCAQEALIFYSDYSRNFKGVEPVSLEWCLSHGVTQDVIDRFSRFQQDSVRSGGKAPNGSRGTFWYYLLYNKV